MIRWDQLLNTKTNAQAELRDLSMDQLRAMEQPDYASAAAANTAAAERLQAMTTVQEQMDEAASLKWKSAAVRLLGIVVSFLVSLWMTAFMIEAGWLAIRVAGDIRTLRVA